MMTSQCFFIQVASFLLYLSDVEGGGETMFPFEVKQPLFSVTFSFRMGFLSLSLSLYF
jgi:hypothetical protein